MRLAAASFLSASAALILGVVIPEFLPTEPHTKVIVLIAMTVLAGLLYFTSLLLWGSKRGWFSREAGSLKKPSKTAQGIRLVESLRKVRGADPIRYCAHIEFLSSAQRPLMEELNSKFQAAGWTTNPGTVPHDRYSQRHAIGIEVSGFNSHLVELVTEILNALGYGPASSEIAQLELLSTNPKWELAQRTVYLFLGLSPTNNH